MLVKRVLAEAGLTRAQLARDTGLNEATIWAWVNGRRIPELESLQRLADGLEKRGGNLQALTAKGHPTALSSRRWPRNYKGGQQRRVPVDSQFARA